MRKPKTCSHCKKNSDTIEYHIAGRVVEMCRDCMGAWFTLLEKAKVKLFEKFYDDK